MEKVVCEKVEFFLSQESYLEYKEMGYPDLDPGMEVILETMFGQGMIPKWCCSGHLGENDGYISFVTLDVSKAFNWFLKFKSKVESFDKNVRLGFEFDNNLLSESVVSDEGPMDKCWSVCFRWGEDSDIGKVMESLILSLEEVRN